MAVELHEAEEARGTSKVKKTMSFKERSKSFKE